MKPVRLIGIDCAVDPANTGLCVADYADDLLIVEEARSGVDREPAEIAADWVYEGPFLLGLDAPLGWPVSLGDSLVEHRAGDPLDLSANRLFRRFADDYTAETIGKRPMDVGADRIARTAHAALSLLGELRRRSGLPLPLGWKPGEAPTGEVLETYPAAWLTVAGLPAKAYKKRDQRSVREEILSGLPEWVHLACGNSAFLDDADLLDALLCLLVYVAYLKGLVRRPPADKAELIRREGWIWVPSAIG